MDINSLVAKVQENVLEPLLALLFGLAFIVFLWGIVEFIRDSHSDEGRSKGKQHVMWGVIGMFIMASVFGITSLIIESLGVDAPIAQPDPILKP